KMSFFTRILLSLSAVAPTTSETGGWILGVARDESRTHPEGPIVIRVPNVVRAFRLRHDRADLKVRNTPGVRRSKVQGRPGSGGRDVMRLGARREIECRRSHAIGVGADGLTDRRKAQCLSGRGEALRGVHFRDGRQSYRCKRKGRKQED